MASSSVGSTIEFFSQNWHCFLVNKTVTLMGVLSKQICAWLHRNRTAFQNIWDFVYCYRFRHFRKTNKSTSSLIFKISNNDFRHLQLPIFFSSTNDIESRIGFDSLSYTLCHVSVSLVRNANGMAPMSRSSASAK